MFTASLIRSAIGIETEMKYINIALTLKTKKKMKLDLIWRTNFIRQDLQK